ncbi:MAG: Kae1-associated serine/threonine protein kinase [Candidatus Aenigmarchaeota archaeon]|nr:Kae1-associated serine/threonine protein kinase [Candidatus Aenigmarchaeota archaeon]
MTKGRIIQRGAEAVLYLDSEGSLVKERVKKGYRIPELDETIRRRRSKLEVRLLDKARRSGIDTPCAALTDDHMIKMDYIDGVRVKDALGGMGVREQDATARKIGTMVAALHSSDIVHGDLTTSNMLLKDGKIFLIDFGLGKVSGKVEDQATDLFLLLEALTSTHYGISARVWKNIIKTYVQKYSNAREVMTRFETIERRRRYK